MIRSSHECFPNKLLKMMGVGEVAVKDICKNYIIINFKNLTISITKRIEQEDLARGKMT